MVKAKRVTARQKVERKSMTPSAPVRRNDDLETIISTANSTPWDVRSSVFSNVEMGSAIIKDRLENFDDSDAKTVITSKSFRGLNIRKKDRRKIKQHIFKQKINLIKEAKEAMKAKKKREKTVVTGDMQPMANSLPTLVPSVEQFVASSSTHRPTKSDQTSQRPQSRKSRMKQQQTDIESFRQVQQHAQYQSNPSATIQEHLKNRMVLEDQL